MFSSFPLPVPVISLLFPPQARESSRSLVPPTTNPRSLARGPLPGQRRSGVARPKAACGRWTSARRNQRGFLSSNQLLTLKNLGETSRIFQAFGWVWLKSVVSVGKQESYLQRGDGEGGRMRTERKAVWLHTLFLLQTQPKMSQLQMWEVIWAATDQRFSEYVLDQNFTKSLSGSAFCFF